MLLLFLTAHISNVPLLFAPSASAYQAFKIPTVDAGVTYALSPMAQPKQYLNTRYCLSAFVRISPLLPPNSFSLCFSILSLRRDEGHTISSHNNH
jgi:hypothetical protein